jgi:hypothetical protein
MIVAAFDPGRVTGYARATIGDERVDGVYPLISFGAKQLNTWEHVHHNLFADEWVDIMIVEDFVGGGPRTTDAIHTLKLVGLIQYGRRDIPVIVQPPQFRRAFVEEARQLLEAKHKHRHGADALAHILYWRYKRE